MVFIRRKELVIDPSPAPEPIISLHSQLVVRAERWLERNGCSIVIRDPFRAATHNGEQPDAIGWRDGVSVLIECKTSRADFLADKNKRFKETPCMGMGDWRFYMSPPDVIHPSDLPAGWGLLWVHNNKIENKHGAPTKTQWHSEKPFVGCKISEQAMLVSALRRLKMKGYFSDIYGV